MRKRTIKIILAAVAVTAVLGVAVAAAATNQSSWTGGRGAQMTNTDRTTRNGDRLHLRARDGTGPASLAGASRRGAGCGRPRRHGSATRAEGCGHRKPLGLSVSELSD